MARPRRSERLARELALDPSVELRPEHESPHVLRRLCILSDEKTIAGDHDCLRVARLCCRLAQRLKTRDARTLSFGRLASALRLAGRLDHSERALIVAFAAAPEELRGYLLRFRSYLRIYQGRLPEAVEDAEAAVELTTGADHAQSLGALGTGLYLSGRLRAAIRAHQRCLAATDPDNGQAYCIALQNYATALAKETDEEIRKALKLCAKARSMLKPRHKMQRAKLRWTEGLLHLRLGNHKKAWRALDTGRRSLIALQAAPEVAAIIADMARVSPQPLAIRQICFEAAAIITGRHPLTRPLATLARAAQHLIPEAAAELRRVACSLAPCPML